MKVAFHTLGCKVNQYETDAMSKMFTDRGHQIVDENGFADVYVINTCTVTAMADRKSRNFIRRMKRMNPDSIIAVTGCYVQIDPESVAAIKGVDLITGINEKGTLPDHVERLVEKKTRDGRIERFVRSYDELGEYEDLGNVTNADGRSRAYIKIEDGCDRFCSYCVIPYARGPVRSRPLEDIVGEAKRLISNGYREIVLTGINTALYGRDRTDPKCDPTHENRPDLETVIAQLNSIEGDFRIRLSSLEPTVVDPEYVKKLIKYDKLCHHMHLSAQSGSDKVLGEMDRNYDKDGYMKIVRALREFDPFYGISTDIIVGFPGEDENDIRDTKTLIKESAFCRTHVFPYSLRQKTKAAKRCDQIPSDVKNRRSREVQIEGKEAAKNFFKSCIGDERMVLWEEFLPDEGLLAGYTDNYIRVYFKVDPEESSEYINTTSTVTLKSLIKDGMRGE